MGTQTKPPKALECEEARSAYLGMKESSMVSHIIKTLMLLVWLMLAILSCHSIACKRIGALPAADVKSAQKAPQAIVRRMACFFQEGQFRGSLGSSVGCGRRTVCKRHAH